MRETVTVSLTSELKKSLDRLSREEGLSRSDLIRESIRDFLYWRRFRRLRERLSAKARSRGFYTDEDVFEQIS